METSSQARKKVRRAAIYKDWKRRRNIIKGEIAEIRNGKRKSLTIGFPKRRKYKIRPMEAVSVKRTGWWQKFKEWVKKLFTKK